MADECTIPAIDLFAGPGGLGEGFSASRNRGGSPHFDIRLSIEKEALAHRTLQLRAFFRRFPAGRAPEKYYDYLRGQITRDALFAAYEPADRAASGEALCAELGAPTPGHAAVRQRIVTALDGSKGWVLLGGPPCQAYSLVGRSRNKGNKEYVAADDKRQTLYVEYLHVIGDHWPAVFVMENVKGMLSASLDGRRVFERIQEDLRDPATALARENRPNATGKRRHRYHIYSLVSTSMFDEADPRQFIVKCEDYGIPQARHRVILIGVRDDLGEVRPRMLTRRDPVPLAKVLRGMPRLRSGLSKEDDSLTAWRSAIEQARDRRWLTSLWMSGGENVREKIAYALTRIAQAELDRGGEFVRGKPVAEAEADWYLDPRLDGYVNHSTRGHIVKDLHRYLFAACFTEAHRYAPEMSEFPADLKPAHKNLKSEKKGEYFADRFRVQPWDRPSTTVVSHISKDGHYYIHPDPVQCRSLTVREAARLQTFPDNYFFEGPRTAQYLQVGNAVPPLLGRQIAQIVAGLLADAGLTS